MQVADKRSLQLMGLLGLALGGGWLLVVVYALHAALPFNPIKLPLETRVQPRFWLPEGWAFFTRDPREENMRVFVRHEGNWVSAGMGPIAKPSNSFGLDRACRAQGVEAALLINGFPSSAFQECRDPVAACLERAPITAEVQNISPTPTLCGDVGVVMQKPVPWAWWSSGLRATMPSRVLRMSVACK